MADKRVEAFVKQRITDAFAEDGFLGERAVRRCRTPVLWVVDPIDGTSCFEWAAYGACRWRSSLTASRWLASSTIPTIVSCSTRYGAMARLNETPIRPHPAATVKEGVMGVGTSHRVTPAQFLPFLDALLSDGGMFIRNGSGALMSAWAAAGRLIGYYEPHMNPWDALPGLVLMREAGRRQRLSGARGIRHGNPSCWPAKRCIPNSKI